MLTPCAFADEVSVQVLKDNTIQSNIDYSNGQGEFFFVGQTGSNGSRRGLLAFDIASVVPAGSTIDSVELSMNISKGFASQPITVHRLLKDWGEGASNAGDPGGGGIAPMEGDATWNYRFFHPTTPEPWLTPGGDFIEAPSASAIGNPAPAEFIVSSTNQLVADVQQWLSNPSSNFGWILIGNEASAFNAKRFFSSEYSTDPAMRPVLNITYTGPGATKFLADADTTWTLASNWSGNKVPDGPNEAVSFGNSSTAPRTVTLDGNRQVRSIQFDHFHAWTIAPGSVANSTLTVGAAGGLGSMSSGPGGHVISAKVLMPGTTDIDIAGDGALHLAGGAAIGAAQNVTKAGEGILTIDGPQTHGAGAKLTVTNGYLHLRSNAGAPATTSQPASAALSLRVASPSGGTLGSYIVIDSSQDLAALEVSYLDPGAQGVDLASTESEFHSIRIYSDNVDDAKASLGAAIRNANAPTASDRFDGIYDSGLHANSGIGIAKRTDAQGKQYVLIRPTRIGDLNLDGTVTIADFIDLASNFNGSGAWQEGDLNYDGQITIADFINLASNFNSSYSGEVVPTSTQDQQMLAAFAASHGVALVPEPAVISLLLVSALAVCSRRRR